MGGSVKKAAPVVLAVAAVVASVYAGPQVGTAIFNAIGTTAAEAGVSAATVGAAAIGGSSSAVNAAVQGKNLEGVLKAGAIGAASGAVGSEVAQAVGGAPIPGETGDIGPGGLSSLTGQAALGPTAGSTAAGAATGFTAGQLGGRTLEESGKMAAIGGATGLLTSGIREGLTEAGAAPEDVRLASSLSGPFISRSVANLFTPQRSASTVGGGGPTTMPIGEPTMGIGAPGSAALGQALRLGSGEPGAPIESPGGGETTAKPVWNIASLRVKDETGG